MSLCLLMMTAANASDRYGKQKVVYHINYDTPKNRQAHCATSRTTLTPSALKTLT